MEDAPRVPRLPLTSGGMLEQSWKILGSEQSAGDMYRWRRTDVDALITARRRRRRKRRKKKELDSNEESRHPVLTKEKPIHETKKILPSSPRRQRPVPPPIDTGGLLPESHSVETHGHPCTIGLRPSTSSLGSSRVAFGRTLPSEVRGEARDFGTFSGFDAKDCTDESVESCRKAKNGGFFFDRDQWVSLLKTVRSETNESPRANSPKRSPSPKAANVEGILSEFRGPAGARLVHLLKGNKELRDQWLACSDPKTLGHGRGHSPQAAVGTPKGMASPRTRRIREAKPSEGEQAENHTEVDAESEPTHSHQLPTGIEFTKWAGMSLHKLNVELRQSQPGSVSHDVLSMLKQLGDGAHQERSTHENKNLELLEAAERRISDVKVTGLRELQYLRKALVKEEVTTSIKNRKEEIERVQREQLLFKVYRHERLLETATKRRILEERTTRWLVSNQVAMTAMWFAALVRGNANGKLAADGTRYPDCLAACTLRPPPILSQALTLGRLVKHALVKEEKCRKIQSWLQRKIWQKNLRTSVGTLRLISSLKQLRVLIGLRINIKRLASKRLRVFLREAKQAMPAQIYIKRFLVRVVRCQRCIRSWLRWNHNWMNALELRWNQAEDKMLKKLSQRAMMPTTETDRKIFDKPSMVRARETVAQNIRQHLKSSTSFKKKIILSLLQSKRKAHVAGRLAHEQELRRQREREHRTRVMRENLEKFFGGPKQLEQRLDGLDDEQRARVRAACGFRVHDMKIWRFGKDSYIGKKALTEIVMDGLQYSVQTRPEAAQWAVACELPVAATSQERRIDA